MSKPIGKAWVDSKSYLIYKFPIMGENFDKIELYRELTIGEKISLESMTLDVEIVRCYVENDKE